MWPVGVGWPKAWPKVLHCVGGGLRADGRPAYRRGSIIDVAYQPVEPTQTWADDAAVPTPTVTLSYIVGPYPNRPDKAGCATRHHLGRRGRGCRVSSSSAARSRPTTKTQVGQTFPRPRSALSDRRFALKAAVSKTGCGPLGPPWVRIPPPPLGSRKSLLTAGYGAESKLSWSRPPTAEFAGDLPGPRMFSRTFPARGGFTGGTNRVCGCYG